MEIVLAKDVEKSIYESLVDGSGFRIVIFLCGCNIACKGCQNRKFWDINNGSIYDIDDLTEYIVSLYQNGNYDGITFSGGDPMYQKDKLLILIKKIRKIIPNINIWCYTGNTYENIADFEVLKYIDVLVDGPFVEELRTVNLRFRGSKNQRLLYLKDGEIQKIK